MFVQHLEHREVEYQAAGLGVIVVLDSLLPGLDVVLVPPALELLAVSPEDGHQLLEPGVVDPASVLSTELGDALPPVQLPVFQHRLHPVAQKELIERVALDPLESSEIAVDHRGRTVPCQDVPPLAKNPGGTVLHLIDEPLEPETHGDRPDRVSASARNRIAAEGEQVPSLVGLEPKGSTDTGEHLGGRPDFAGLLQPGVPLGAYPSSGGNFFPPKSRCSPSATSGKTQFLRLSPHPARLQEIRDLPPTFFT